MSRQRVVEGTDGRGRPKARWADADSDKARGYGHMEPAFVSTIERRKATPEELEAARARETEPRHLTAPSLVRPTPVLPSPNVQAQMQASRMNGADRHIEVMAARKAAPPPEPRPEPSPEEETVSEAAQDLSTESPQALELVEDTLSVLAEAVVEAIEAQTARIEAETRWLNARGALDAAYQALDVPSPSLPLPIAQMPSPARRSRTGEGQRPGQSSERDRRAATVMSAMERLDDDMDAVAAELGMKKNAVAQIVKHARLRAGATS